MRRKVHIILTSLTVIFVLIVSAGAAFAVPPTLSRAQIQQNAGSGIGYPYGLGWESWDNTTCGCNKYGKCKDSYEKWGMDCSGYVQKAWQVPTALDFKKELTSNRYTTYTFRCTKKDWTSVSRSSMKYMDSLVYYSDCGTTSGSGHMALYTGKTASTGQLCVDEARSCVYGVLYNCRTFSSSYTAIKRNNLKDP